MRGKEMLDMIEGLNPRYVEAAADAPKRKKSTWLKRFGAIAACVAVLFSAGLGIYAYAAEVKEYNDAIRFFHAHDLSTEGLTRGEIKMVYRDITTESFSYTKTAEVIANSMNADEIKGFEILQNAPTPEDIENLWNCKNYNGNFLFPKKESVYYQYDAGYTETENGKILFDQSYLKKYDGETLIWEVAVPEFEIRGYHIISDGVIAYGETYGISGRHESHAWMAKFDENGNLIWKIKMENGFEDEYIASILENDDGSYAVISRGDFKYFCFSRYSAEGKKMLFNKTEVGNYGIWNAARLRDGYIVQIGSYMANEHAKIIKVDHEGYITESFSYSAEDRYYYITDMIEFGGKIYLSAYAVPKPENEKENAGGRYEIAGVLNDLFDQGIWEISSEELTPMVRKNYTAILLVCDPDIGVPQEFYSVEGSLGGNLSLSEYGELLWDVESFATTFYSPATSSFTIGGTCYVFRYTFDDLGGLVSQEKTDQVTNYRR